MPSLTKEQAQDLARELRKLEGYVPLGLKPLDKGYALVIKDHGKRRAIMEMSFLDTLDRAEPLRGHAYIVANVCSSCGGTLRANDTHWHEHLVEHSRTSAGSEPHCCACSPKFGRTCPTLLGIPIAPLDRYVVPVAVQHQKRNKRKKVRR